MISWNCSCGAYGTGSPLSHMKICVLIYDGVDSRYSVIEFYRR